MAGSLAAAVETGGLRAVNPSLDHLSPLAQIIAKEIVSGQRTVGSFIPAEKELCATYGMSRYSVREAMITLQDLGLIEKRRGIGTRVMSQKPSDHHLYRLDTLSDLMSFTRATNFTIFDRTTITSCTDPDRFTWKVPNGKKWLRIQGTRFAASSGKVVSSDVAYLQSSYADVLVDGDTLKTNLFVLLEEKYRLRPDRIEQDVGATVLTSQQAHSLNVAPGTAGLNVARQFVYGSDPLIFTSSLHPAANFSYSTTFHVTRAKST